jgi:hypothetical protein
MALYLEKQEKTKQKPPQKKGLHINKNVAMT